MVLVDLWPPDNPSSMGHRLLRPTRTVPLRHQASNSSLPRLREAAHRLELYSTTNLHRVGSRKPLPSDGILHPGDVPTIVRSRQRPRQFRGTGGPACGPIKQHFDYRSHRPRGMDGPHARYKRHWGIGTWCGPLRLRLLGLHPAFVPLSLPFRWHVRNLRRRILGHVLRRCDRSPTAGTGS